MNFKLIIIIFFIIFFIIILYVNKKINTNSFNELLKLRRKLERVKGYKKNIIINKSNINKYKNNDYFYTLIDSGNIGSKSNSDFYASHLGIKVINKYYLGKLKNITIPNNIKNFIIKPYNLCNSQGLLLIKNMEDIILKKNFNSTNDIINHYTKNYMTNNEQIVIVQEFINSKIRPPEIKIYSFNGKVGLILYIKWLSEGKREISFFTENWDIICGDYIEKPIKLKQIIKDSNLYTKNLKTFMRIDFLIDEFSGEYYFCEVSSYPLCANKYTYPSLTFDKYLYKYWENNFPYNKYTIEEIKKITKHYTKKESCEK